jgi:hypothetical protein
VESLTPIRRSAREYKASAIRRPHRGRVTVDRPVNVLRRHYPDIAIHARGRARHHCDQLLQAGATTSISETLEASLQPGGAVLDTMGVIEEDAAALIESFRKEYHE